MHASANPVEREAELFRAGLAGLLEASESRRISRESTRSCWRAHVKRPGSSVRGYGVLCLHGEGVIRRNVDL